MSHLNVFVTVRDDQDPVTVEINKGENKLCLSFDEAHYLLERLQADLFLYAYKRLEKVTATIVEKEKKPHLRLVK